MHESSWYPRRSMKAAERISYYAARFPVVEIDATGRFPPTPDLSRQWADRTPDGFTIDVHGWSLLVGAATLPDSLWEDLRDEVRPEMRDRRRLYIGHLSAAAVDESWARFAHALRPLSDSGRLGAVLMRYPPWLRPGETGRALMAEARRRLPDLPLAVELRNQHWLDGRECENTLAFLDAHEMSFVCVDGASYPSVVATTSELGVLRLYGRNPGNWEDEELAIAERFAYSYSDEELRALVPRVRELADGAAEVHVIFANTWRDDAVTNAARLAALLDE